jgi:predicted acetyltransferase
VPSLQLIAPDVRYKDSYAAALREGLHLQPAPEEDILLAEEDFEAYLKKRNDLSRPVFLPSGAKVKRLPQLDFWLVSGDTFLGMASLRPQLNEYLSERGGNIGYAVRKSERRKGYGKLILKLALPEARKSGLQKVLITCHDQNAGSIRIIEGAGGVLQDKIKIDGLEISERRYWLKL